MTAETATPTSSTLDSQFKFQVGEGIKVMRKYRRWQQDPSAYEGRPKITPEENNKVKQILEERYGSQVRSSNLAIEGAAVSDGELQLVHQMVVDAHEIEEEVIPDKDRRPLNASTLEHFQQVEAYFWVMAEQIPGININRGRAQAALHDKGREETHDPVLHLIGGRQRLKELGFAPDFRKTALAHGEAGIGPYIYGITPDTWPILSKDQSKLDQMINNLPITDVLIAVADMGKRGIQQPDGSFVNTISGPLEGLAPSAKRRLKTEKGEPSDEVLMGLGNADPEVREQSMQALRDLGATETNINQMAMYFGWLAGLKRRLENDYGIQFEGPNNVAELAQRRFEEMRENYTSTSATMNNGNQN